jgi:sugar lactone lactonase YvrE
MYRRSFYCLLARAHSLHSLNLGMSSLRILALVGLACTLLVLPAWGQSLSLNGGSNSVLFADTSVGASTTRQVQFFVNAEIMVTAVSATGDFSITDMSGCALPLQFEDTCTLQVRFAPTAPGKRDVPLMITASDGGKFSFALRGWSTGAGLAFTPGTISTIAGTGEVGYAGDGGPATSAQLTTPVRVVRDNAGNVYISDYSNYVVRKIDGSGNISTVAGNGTQGNTGDGGQAVNAELKTPMGLAVDAFGNLYIADQGNHNVRKVDVNGIITTAANVYVPDGVVVDDAGNLYVGSYYADVYKIDTEGTQTRYAGNGDCGYSGDGGPATAAQTWTVSGLALDRAGNLYFAEIINEVIRKVDTNGIISTVAGNHISGYSGDGGPATAAKLAEPYDVAVDAAGDLYIADSDNRAIRKVDAAGNITTVAGPGENAGDGILATSAYFMPLGIALDGKGNFYIADSINAKIRKVDANTAPSLEYGTVDLGQSSLQTVVVSNTGTADVNFTGINSTSANFVLQTDCPTDGALSSGANCFLGINFTPLWTGDIWGNIELDDNVGGMVQVIQMHGVGNQNVPLPPPVTQLVFVPAIPATVANGGNLGSVSVNAEDSDGNVVTSFNGDVSIQLRGPAEDTLLQASGNASDGVATFDLSETTLTESGTSQLQAWSNQLDLSDSATFQVLAAAPPITLGGGITGHSVLFNSTSIGQNTTKTVTLDITGSIMLEAVNAGGDYTITDASGCALDTPLAQGAHCVLTIRFTPTAPGQRWYAMVLTDSNGRKYSFGLAGFGTGAALGFPPGIGLIFAGNGDWDYYGDGGPATQAALSGPMAVVRDPDGNFYIADSENSVVRKVDTEGLITTIAGNGSCGYGGDNGPATSAELCYVVGIALDAAGNLYIADSDYSVVRKVDVNGIITTVANDSDLNSPSGVASDNVGNVYVADSWHCVIRKVDTSGAIITVAGSLESGCGYSGDGGPATAASLAWPEGIAVDNAGNLYIADSQNSVIRKVDGNGIITTVAGDKSYAYGGDGGPATEAHLAYPMAVAVDGAGDLFITDSDNAVIRKVDTHGIISTVEGTFNGGIFRAQPGKQTRAQKRANPDHKALRGAAKQQRQAATRTVGGNKPKSRAMNRQVSLEFYGPTDAIVDGTGNLYIVDHDGSVVYKADMTAGPLLDFGSLNVGQTSDPQTATVANVGNGDLQFTQISIASHFLLQEVEGGCATETAVTASGSCGLSVTFAPTVDGTIDGAIAMTDNASGSPHSVSLTGTGTALPATQLAFENAFPLVAFGGNLGTVAVDLKDGSGAIVAGSTVSVALQIAGPAGFTTYNASVNAVSGVAGFDLSAVPLNVAGNYTITASSDALTNASANFTVSPAVVTATKVVFVTVFSEVPFGGNLGTVTAQLEDNAANLATGSNASVSVHVTGPVGFTTYNASVNAASGIATFNLSAVVFNSAGNYTITAASNGLTGASANFTVDTPVASQVVFGAAIPATVAFGSNLGTVTARLEDGAGNIATGSSASVAVQITGPAGFTSYNASVTAVAGVATFDLSAVTLNVAGSYTLTTSSTGLTSAAANFTVNTPVATKVAFGSAIPATVAFAGNLGTVTAQLEDTAGNLAAGSSVSVSVHVTGPVGFTSYNASVNAASGIATFNLGAVAFNVAGSYTIATSSSGLTGTSVNFTVDTPVATKVVFGAAIPATVAFGGNLGTVTARLEDGAGNLATGSSASVAVQITGTAGFTTYNASVNAVAGVASFNLSAVTLNVAGSYTITTSSSGLTSVQATFTVSAAADFDLTLAAQSVTVISGSPGTVSLTLSPTGGFSGAFALSCSGLPTHAGCSFNPATVTADGSNTVLHSVLTIHTNGTLVGLNPPRKTTVLFAWWTGAGVFGLLLFPTLGRGTARKRWTVSIGLALLALLMLAGLPGCGGGSNPVPPPAQNTPPGSYSVTINATAAGTTHSSVVTLQVN